MADTAQQQPIISTWIGLSVIIDDESAALYVFELGSFGYCIHYVSCNLKRKGTLSRGFPEVAAARKRGPGSKQDELQPVGMNANRDAMFARAEKKRLHTMSLVESGAHEQLQLSLVEAFYLAYELKTLQIQRQDEVSTVVCDVGID